MHTLKYYPGINIQFPWSQLILSGEKTVETRNYPIPSKYLDTDLLLIETPGPTRSIEKARGIALIKFSAPFKYESLESWIDDFDRHKVPKSDQAFQFREGKLKFGWPISSVTPLPLQAISIRRGIIFTCRVPVSLNKERLSVRNHLDKIDHSQPNPV